MNYRVLILSAALLLSALGAGVYLRAQNVTDGDTIARFNASLAIENDGDVPGALAEMQAIAGHAKSNYLVAMRFGWLEFQNGRFRESVTHYRRAVELTDGKSVEPYLGLRLPLAAIEEWAEVEEIYRKILRIDPANYEANLRLGQMHMHRGEHAAARGYLAKAHNAYPGEYEANLSSGWNHYFLRETNASRACFETALMLSPGDTSAARGLQLVK